eukprot:962735-Rhodomonas_salina.1
MPSRVSDSAVWNAARESYGHCSDSLVSALVFGLVPVASFRSQSFACVHTTTRASDDRRPQVRALRRNPFQHRAQKDRISTSEQSWEVGAVCVERLVIRDYGLGRRAGVGRQWSQLPAPLVVVSAWDLRLGTWVWGQGLGTRVQGFSMWPSGRRWCRSILCLASMLYGLQVNSLWSRGQGVKGQGSVV